MTCRSVGGFPSASRSSTSWSSPDRRACTSRVSSVPGGTCSSSSTTTVPLKSSPTRRLSCGVSCIRRSPLHTRCARISGRDEAYQLIDGWGTGVARRSLAAEDVGKPPGRSPVLGHPLAPATEVRYGVAGDRATCVRDGAEPGERDLRPRPVPGLRVRRAHRLPGRPRAGAAPPRRRAGRRRRPGLRRAPGALRRPRCGHRPVGRRAARRGRRRDLPGPAQAGPGGRPGRPPRDRRARRHEPRRSPPRPRRTGSTTRPTRAASRSARSAATSRRTPAARTASSTGSPRTTCWSSRSCWPTGRW